MIKKLILILLLVFVGVNCFVETVKLKNWSVSYYVDEKYWREAWFDDYEDAKKFVNEKLDEEVAYGISQGNSGGIPGYPFPITYYKGEAINCDPWDAKPCSAKGWGKYKIDTDRIKSRNSLEVDGYRIFYGKDKTMDWVDVVNVRSSIDIEKVIFEDKSPIKMVFYDKYYNYLVIYKKHSVWRLYDIGNIWRMRLDLIKPYLMRIEKSRFTVIYEKK